MSDLTTLDPVVARLGAAPREFYGSRLERAVLFGSRARGDFSDDYDVAVFLHDYQGLWPELRPLSAITTEILFDTWA